MNGTVEAAWLPEVRMLLMGRAATGRYLIVSLTERAMPCV